MRTKKFTLTALSGIVVLSVFSCRNADDSVIEHQNLSKHNLTSKTEIYFNSRNVDSIKCQTNGDIDSSKTKDPKFEPFPPPNSSNFPSDSISVSVQ